VAPHVGAPMGEKKRGFDKPGRERATENPREKKDWAKHELSQRKKREKRGPLGLKGAKDKKTKITWNGLQNRPTVDRWEKTWTGGRQRKKESKKTAEEKKTSPSRW